MEREIEDDRDGIETDIKNKLQIVVPKLVSNLAFPPHTDKN